MMLRFHIWANPHLWRQNSSFHSFLTKVKADQKAKKIQEKKQNTSMYFSYKWSHVTSFDVFQLRSGLSYSLISGRGGTRHKSQDLILSKN